MKAFIYRTVIFFSILTLLVSPLVLNQIGGDNWKYIDNPTASIIEKMNRLSTIKSPKLIIVGGSNAFFGVNSGKLNTELGVEVVNMAQFGGFGVNFMLNQLSGHINKGDIVLLSIEYFLKLNIEQSTFDEIIKYYPAAKKINTQLKVGSFAKYKDTFSNNLESFFTVLTKPIIGQSPVFKHSRSINEFGDAIGYLKYSNPPQKREMPKLKYRYYEGIDTFKKFVADVNTIGAKVYIAMPPIPESGYEVNKGSIEQYFTDLNKALNSNILCRPNQMVFNDSLFFDTYYHLNRRGREIRTDSLISFIERK